MSNTTRAYLLAKAYAHDIEALGYIVKCSDDDCFVHERITDWFSIHAPSVDYIIASADGLYIGAIIHHDSEPRIWTNTADKRTYCITRDGETASVPTPCEFLDKFCRDDYMDKLY
jgi:hypothetical protein